MHSSSSSRSQTPVSVATVLSSLRRSARSELSHSSRTCESINGEAALRGRRGGLLGKPIETEEKVKKVTGKDSRRMHYRHSSQDLEAFLSTLGSDTSKKSKEHVIRSSVRSPPSPVASPSSSDRAVLKKKQKHREKKNKNNEPAEYGIIQRVHIAAVSPFAAALAAEWAEAQQCLEPYAEEDDGALNAEKRRDSQKQKRDRRSKVEREVLSTLYHFPIEADEALRQVPPAGGIRDERNAVGDSTVEERVTSAAAFIDSVAPYLVAFAATPIPTRSTQSGALAALQALLNWTPDSSRRRGANHSMVTTTDLYAPSSQVRKKNRRSWSPPRSSNFHSAILDPATLVNMIFLDARSDALEAFAFSLSTLAQDIVEGYTEKQRGEEGLEDIQLLRDVVLQLLDVLCQASHSSESLQQKMGSPSSGVFPACLEMFEALLSICSSTLPSPSSPSSSSPEKSFWNFETKDAIFFLSCFYRLGQLFHVVLNAPGTHLFSSSRRSVVESVSPTRHALLTLSRVARELVHLLSVVPSVKPPLIKGNNKEIKREGPSSEKSTTLESDKNILSKAIKDVKKSRDQKNNHESAGSTQMSKSTEAKDDRCPFAAYLHHSSASPTAEERWMRVLCQYTHLLALLTRRSSDVFNLLMEDDKLEVYGEGNEKEEDIPPLRLTALSAVFSFLWTSSWGDALEAGCWWWVALAQQTAEEGRHPSSKNRPQEDDPTDSNPTPILSPKARKQQQAEHLEQLSYVLGCVLDHAPTVISRFREALTWGKPVQQQNSMRGGVEDSADDPFASVSPVATTVARCWRWIVCVCPSVGSAMVTSQREVCLTFVKMILEFPKPWLKQLAPSQPHPNDSAAAGRRSPHSSSCGGRRPSSSRRRVSEPHERKGASAASKPTTPAMEVQSPSHEVVTWITELAFTFSLAYLVGSAETQTLLREWLGVLSDTSSDANAWLGLNDVTRAELERRMQQLVLETMGDSGWSDVLAIRVLSRQPSHRTVVAYHDEGVVTTRRSAPDTIKGVRDLLLLSIREWLRRPGSPQHDRLHASTTTGAAQQWKGNVVAQTRGYGPQPPFLLRGKGSDGAAWTECGPVHHGYGPRSRRSSSSPSSSAASSPALGSSSSSSLSPSSLSFPENGTEGRTAGQRQRGEKYKKTRRHSSHASDRSRGGKAPAAAAATPRGHLHSLRDASTSSFSTTTRHSLSAVSRIKSVPVFTFLQARHRHQLTRYRVVTRARSLQGNFMHQSILLVLRLAHHCSVSWQTRHVQPVPQSSDVPTEGKEKGVGGVLSRESIPSASKTPACGGVCDRNSPSVLHGKERRSSAVLASRGGASPYETEDWYPFRILSTSSISPSQEVYVVDPRSGSMYIAGRQQSSKTHGTALGHLSTSSSWLEANPPPPADGASKSSWLNSSRSTKWNATMNASRGEGGAGSDISPLPRRPEGEARRPQHRDSAVGIHTPAEAASGNPWARKHKKHYGRQWDVEFLQPEDVLTFYCGNAETREVDLQEAIAATVEHVKYLYEQRRMCPVSLVQRRSLIQDLYVNVYPKVYRMLRHIERSAGFSSSVTPAFSSASIQNVYASIAVRRLLEKDDFTIHSGNLLEVFDTISHCDASLPF